MTVCGGFRFFPRVTSSCYSLRVDSQNQRWAKLRDIPEPLNHMAQTVDAEVFYGVGGFTGPHPGPSVKSAYEFNRSTNTWRRLPDLPAARAGGGVVLYEEGGARHLIYAGGVRRKKSRGRVFHKDYGTTYRLDLRDLGKGWVNENASMPDPRNHMGAVRSCGRYFWVGGQYKEREAWGNRKTVSEYLPNSKGWSTTPPAQLPIALGHISASVMAYKCGIMVVGGIGRGRRKSSKVLFWESSTDEWHTIGNYPTTIATPVCGIHKQYLWCGTGNGKYYKGRPHPQRAFYKARINTKTI